MYQRELVWLCTSQFISVHRREYACSCWTSFTNFHSTITFVTGLLYCTLKEVRNSFLQENSDCEDVPTPLDTIPPSPSPVMSPVVRKRLPSDSGITTGGPSQKKSVPNQLLHPLDEAIEKKKLGKSPTYSQKTKIKLSFRYMIYREQRRP